MRGDNKNIPKRRFREFLNGDDWEKRKVQDLVNDEILATPMDGNHGEKHPTTSDYVTSGIPFIMARDLGCGHVDLEHCNFISKERAERLDKGFAHNGDVLLTHKATIGENAILKGLKEKYAVLTPQVTYYRIMNSEKLSRDFLYAYFNTIRFQTELKTEAIQSTRAYIGITSQCKLSVRFPMNIEEQKKIGDYFFNLDNLITLHQHKLEKIQALKKSYLFEMFPIDCERKPKRRFSGFTNDWEKHKLEEVSNLLTGYPFESKRFVSEGIKLIRGMNVKRNFLDISDNICVYWTSSSGLEEYLLQDKDILIQMDGALIGKSYAKIMKNQLPALLVQRVARVRNKGENVDIDFIYQSIQRGFLAHIEDIKTETAVPHLSLNDIRIYKIMLPKYEEQKKIGLALNHLDTLITLHQQKLTKLQNIKKAYLNEMFI